MERYKFSNPVSDKPEDGILSVSLKRKTFSILIIAVYFRPYEHKNYKCRQEKYTAFLNKLFSVLQTHLKHDMRVCAEDFNARVGKMLDIHIDNSDAIPPRVVKDEKDNPLGRDLIDCLIDAKCCIVNARITPENDNFTFIKGKIKTVVDYIIVPKDYLDYCTYFNVYTIDELNSWLNTRLKQNHSLKTRVAQGHSVLEFVISTVKK